MRKSYKCVIVPHCQVAARQHDDLIIFYINKNRQGPMKNLCANSRSCKSLCANRFFCIKVRYKLAEELV